MSDANVFANSWSVDSEQCPADPDPEDPCEEGSQSQQLAMDLCYTLVAKNGPFSDCHELVDPTPYYEACVYDLCATLPDDDVLCDSFSQYAEACRNTGGMPEDWRSVTPQCGKLNNYVSWVIWLDSFKDIKIVLKF